MTDRLPPNLLRLFQPRPPVEYLPPIDTAPIDRKAPTLSGVTPFIDLLKTYDLNYVHKETPAERRERLKAERILANDARIANELETWDPHKNEEATSDPFKTLFVGRLNYKTSKDSLAHEFERFGPISKIKLVKNKQTNMSRGYAFIEYERESDMMAAVKAIDGVKLDDRRIVVDVERARTVKNWRPRRLGGGLGHTRLGPKWVNQEYYGRDQTNNNNKRGTESVPMRRRSPERYRSRSRDRNRSYRSTNDRSSGRRQRSQSRSRRREYSRYGDREYRRD